MAIIPQVKCSRCDRKYSGLRTRCPYCGARRYARSKRAAQEDNSMWKVVVGVLLLVVLIAAVVVLIVTSANDTPSTPAPADNTPATNEPTSVVNDPITDDPAVTTDPNTVTDPENGETGTTPDEPTNTDTPTTPENNDVPKPMVNTIIITYNNRQAGVYNSTEGLYEITMKAGETLNLGTAVTPQGIEAEIVWESSNEGVVAVLQNGKVTAVGKGTCTISATADDVKAELMIRVRG